MDAQTLNSFAQELRRRRADVIARVAHTQEDLDYLSEDRESEWSDRALEERTMHLLSRLDVRETEAVRALDAALGRIKDGTYGRYANCGQELSGARLRAMPTARLCPTCARELEPSDLAAAEENIDSNVEVVREDNPREVDEDDLPDSGRVPPDLSLLSDEERQGVIYDQVRDDGRVEMEELQVACRNGVVILNGALPSEREHSILLQLITDVLGFEEVVDHLEVEDWAWQRDERNKAEPPAPGNPPNLEMDGTDDVVESSEEVLDDVPPLGQPKPEGE
jgi:RNA polymerase-binding transcription factor DksA